MWRGGGRIGLSVSAPFDLETFPASLKMSLVGGQAEVQAYPAEGPGLAKTGSGVSRAGGAWLNEHCDPQRHSTKDILGNAPNL